MRAPATAGRARGPVLVEADELAAGRVPDGATVAADREGVLRQRRFGAAGTGPEGRQALPRRPQGRPERLGPGLAGVWDAFVELAVDGHHGHRFRRRAAGRLQAGRDHRDPGDLVGVLAGVTVGDHAAVGETDKEHPLPVDRIVLLQMRDERP